MALEHAWRTSRSCGAALLVSSAYRARGGGNAGGLLVDGKPCSTGPPISGLEIFIAADVISSVVSPTWNKVGLLAAIVGIRTVLSYFLRM